MSYNGLMTLVEMITRELHHMPQDQLMKVLKLVAELSPDLARRQRESLAASHGIMDDEQGAIFEEAVLGTESESEEVSK